MRLMDQLPLSALLLGPLAYYRAGHRRRAWASASLAALLVLADVYMHYLRAFEALTVGDDSVRGTFITAIAATRACFLTSASWAPGAIALLFCVYLACAFDLTILSRKRGIKTQGG